MKTVAMENTQWSWHCECRHCSSSDNYGFSPERLQFSRDNTNREKDWTGKHVKQAYSNFNHQGRPWGWLTKWWKKHLHYRTGMSVCSHRDTTRRGSITELESECVLHRLCLGRWMCPSQQRTDWISRWPQGPGYLHLQSIICFTTVKTLNV